MQIHKFEISRRQRATVARRTVAVLAVSFGIVTAMSASAATLDRIKSTGHIKLGYLADGRPFTHKTAQNNVQGFSAALCEKLVESVKTHTGLGALAVDWIEVAPANHVSDVKQGKVDVLCTPVFETAAKRADISFSKPVFPGGVRAVVRKDTGNALRQALAESSQPRKPVWRGSPASRVLKNGKFAVMGGTSAERWLKSKINEFQIEASVVPVADYATGIKQLMAGEVDVFFGDRAIAIGSVDLTQAASQLEILPRAFTLEPLSLPIPRDDDDFRLLVDRTLSAAYADPGFPDLYSKWNGNLDDQSRAFFQWVSFAP